MDYCSQITNKFICSPVKPNFFQFVKLLLAVYDLIFCIECD